jgi:phosphatidylinositol alpha-1,6-mannosyltransferase
LSRLVKAERISAVHCGCCLPEGLLGLALKALHGTPYICYAHGEELEFTLTSRELTWLTRRVLHRAEFVIANSRNTAQILADQWSLPPDRLHVLHPGVDTGRFRPADRDPDLRAWLGWGDRPVVLTVGRLQKRKGHDQMTLALVRVRKVIPDALYAVVGSGEEGPALRDLVEHERLGGAVQFLGELDDERLIQCYQQCDLFALPNRRVGPDIEGFGMVLVEAQSCGKPVVAGASGGTSETMRIPETGLVVPCDGPDELAALVIELLSDRDRLARMGRAGRRWAVERFDWASLCREAAELFRSVPLAPVACPETIPTHP